MGQTSTDLKQRIDRCMLADRRRLRKRLRALERRRGKSGEELRARFLDDLTRAEARIAQRLAGRPTLQCPESLPVCTQREVITAALQAHQVIVVCGETGSGKTTQLPKICLEAGRGIRAMIGHTQPRRIAARGVANRIATELDSHIGAAVGYKVRFGDHVGPQCYIKLMTDGILLAELQGDRLLEQYDTLIIDEAHERSLNIDFVLGYLHHLLPRRPDLKVIVTSATIDPQRFSHHFADAPIIEVSGRTYPVEVHYRPLHDRQEGGAGDMMQGILDAVDETSRAGPGDALVFLSGEREIRDAAEALRKHHPPHTEILPLYARLSAAEQNRVFQSHPGRRIVLATNVAETSLTVPGIRYVIDPGYARLSRYSYRSKVQRLPIEKISQASADQRKGRCGRVSAGICIRLYDEADFDARPTHTDPEILRTNLASVILQMKALQLGDIERFPFIDPPNPRFVNDGYRLLEELSAVRDGKVTALGRRLARLPVDPRVARMVLAGHELGCLAEMLIIAGALSIQDPRERPLDARDKADAAHAQFNDERSDFVAFLNLWRFYAEQRRHLSQRKLRRLCKERFLSFVRMEEWRDIHNQLSVQTAEMDMRPQDSPAEYEPIHQALLSGLLANIGFHAEAAEYDGARNTRFAIFPGSGLGRKRPKWVMAASLLETRRIYGHTVARIEPAWIERAGAHLLQRSYAEPHWEARSGQVAAFEKTSLYGLTVTPRRKVNFGPVDPATAREVFIRAALVEQGYRSKAPFWRHNTALLEEVRALEHKSRRQDILVDDAVLYAFYDQRIPADIYSTARFDKWRKDIERDTPQHLYLTRESLMQHDASGVSAAQYPPALSVVGVDLALSYHFEPGHEEDGVTVTVPLALLNALQPARFEWLVPGLLHEKMMTLIKSLPKALRRNFVPAPQFATACLQALQPGDLPLVQAMTQHLEKMTGVSVPAQAWREADLPTHLQMRFRVVDERGKTVDTARDLSALQDRLRDRASRSFTSAAHWPVERDGLTDWDFDALPASITSEVSGLQITGYPALVDETSSVAVRVFDTPDKATAAHRTGLRRLFMLSLRKEIKYLARNLPDIAATCLHYATVGRCEELKQDLLASTVDAALAYQADAVRSRDAFQERLRTGAPTLVQHANDLAAQVAQILASYNQLRKSLQGTINPAWLPAVQDLRQQLALLIYPGFVTATPPEQLTRLPRYLQAMQARLDKLRYAPERDARPRTQLAPLWARYTERLADGETATADPALETYRWMLEELRVSLFAQELGTTEPVSVERVEKQWRKAQQAAQTGR